MGRIFDTLHVGKSRLYTLFDTGAKHSFVAGHSVAAAQVNDVRIPFKVKLGGQAHRVRKSCLLQGTLRKKPVFLNAFVLPEIGADADGRPIDVIFGADAMQDFGIRLSPEQECVDLAHYHCGFVEF